MDVDEGGAGWWAGALDSSRGLGMTQLSGLGKAEGALRLGGYEGLSSAGMGLPFAAWGCKSSVVSRLRIVGEQVPGISEAEKESPLP